MSLLCLCYGVVEAVIPNINAIVLYRMFLNGLFKKKDKSGIPEKLNIITVFNKSEEPQHSQSNKNLHLNNSQKRGTDFESALSSPIVNLELLKQLAWDGVPLIHRSKTWKILLKYMPTNKQTQEATLRRKRTDYFQMVKTYIEKPTLERDTHEKKIYKLINDDVVRTLPESPLFRNQKIQLMMRRLLYVWHMRHPASGYVQGINDIVTPFIIVYLGEFVSVNQETLQDVKELQDARQEDLDSVEADSYWCLSKMLDGILDNYTSSWPGIQKSFVKLNEIIKRIDNGMVQHFTKQNIDFYHLYFKWVTCLLLRQFTSKVGLRLYDTYLSDQASYSTLCLYIMAAILLKYSKKFKKMSFQQMMVFQQNMPTREWTEEDLSNIIAEAYVYRTLFEK